MKTRPAPGPVVSRAVALLAAAAALAFAGPLVRLAAAYPDQAPGGGGPWQLGLTVTAAGGAVAGGAWLAAHRATAGCGALLALAGPALLAGGLPAAQTQPAVLFTLALAFAALAPALLGAAALSCPVGPPRRRDELAAAGLVTAGLVTGLLPAAVYDPRASGCFSCAANLVLVTPVPGAHDALVRAGLALTVVIAAGAAGLAGWRWLRAPGVVRLVNAPLALGGSAAAALAAAAAGHALAQPAPGIDPVSRGLRAAQCAVVVATAAGLAATALRTRWKARQVAAEVLAATPDAGTLTRSLARSIGDPDLQLVFTRDDGTRIDAAGQPAAAAPAGTGRRAVATVQRGQQTVAEIGYRAELAGAGQLLGSALRGAGLAVEHVAAQARLRAELADLASSRARIIEDADAERRRLERDLHDGAQQQLIGLQLFLQLAAGEAPPGDVPAYRAARQAVGAALADLRDLAHGIHPAALTDDGLMTGLRTLANRSPVPLSVAGPGPVARSAAAEAAAYRLAGYAVHVAGGLDGRPAVRVTVGGDTRTLRVQVEADTGEQAAAAIMTRARDRIAAAGGTATAETVAAGDEPARTTITAVFPCAS